MTEEYDLSLHSSVIIHITNDSHREITSVPICFFLCTEEKPSDSSVVSWYTSGPAWVQYSFGYDSADEAVPSYRDGLRCIPITLSASDAVTKARSLTRELAMAQWNSG